MMTRSRFCEIQTHRGYKVTNIGLITFLDYEDTESTYSAMWFFNADGTLNRKEKPQWTITHK